jgi:hypothetical protein
MIIECACGRLETRHDTSSHRIKGLCHRCRAEKLARIKYLSRMYPAVFAPILRYAGKGKLATRVPGGIGRRKGLKIPRQ